MLKNIMHTTHNSLGSASILHTARACSFCVASPSAMRWRRRCSAFSTAGRHLSTVPQGSKRADGLCRGKTSACQTTKLELDVGVTRMSSLPDTQLGNNLSSEEAKTGPTNTIHSTAVPPPPLRTAKTIIKTTNTSPCWIFAHRRGYTPVTSMSKNCTGLISRDPDSSLSANFPRRFKQAACPL